MYFLLSAPSIWKKKKKPAKNVFYKFLLSHSSFQTEELSKRNFLIKFFSVMKKCPIFMSFWCTWDTYRRKSVRNKMKEGKRLYYVSENLIKALKLAMRIPPSPGNFTEYGWSLSKCKTLPNKNCKLFNINLDKFRFCHVNEWMPPLLRIRGLAHSNWSRVAENYLYLFLCPSTFLLIPIISLNF